MGKKHVAVLGSEDEQKLKTKHAVQLEQKKLRQGKKPAEEEIVVNPALTTNPQGSEKVVKKARIRSKAYLTAKSQVDALKTYPLAEAFKLLRSVSLSKFDPTVELHITLNSSPSTLSLEVPHSTGKAKRVALADDSTISKIEAGQIDFDILLATPAQMGKLVKLAKVLGPRGLMPNPKNGTVVPNPGLVMAKFSSDKALTLKAEKDTPVIHTRVGKLSASDKDLSENVQAILKPLTQIRKIVLKSTMSPAIKIMV